MILKSKGFRVSILNKIFLIGIASYMAFLQIVLFDHSDKNIGESLGVATAMVLFAGGLAWILKWFFKSNSRAGQIIFHVFVLYMFSFQLGTLNKDIKLRSSHLKFMLNTKHQNLFDEKLDNHGDVEDPLNDTFEYQPLRNHVSISPFKSVGKSTNSSHSNNTP